ncbi:MAG: DNA alkylation repair protein [Bacteroidales bacterium]|nr:DNA alkylation repair protein [Bacteroidales bacterium]
MAQALKHIFSQEFYDVFIEDFSRVYPLDSQMFLSNIYNSEWEQKTLKQRITHTAHVLHACVHASYCQMVDFFIEYCNIALQKQTSQWGLAHMFIPEYIQLYGTHDFATSMRAIEHITKLASCEFAIREFIHLYPQKTIQQLLQWSKHSHAAVRRLASEGCRPRLPWATQILEFRKNPHHIIPILENLKADSSAFVRKSVANSLNDISKDNPQCVLTLCAQWKGFHAHTDWIIKHGLRTLLKQGNTEALLLCGISSARVCKIQHFTLNTPTVSALQPLHISFEIINTYTKIEKCRIEYALYFLRKNGTYSRKVFFIRELNLPANTTIQLQKQHSFIPRTTRKYYKGKQYVSCIINGVENMKKAFYYTE